MTFLNKTEWYFFVIAGITLALIYNQAAGNLAVSFANTVSSVMNTAMGKNAAGVFQTPFAATKTA